MNGVLPGTTAPSDRPSTAADDGMLPTLVDVASAINAWLCEGISAADSAWASWPPIWPSVKLSPETLSGTLPRKSGSAKFLMPSPP